jgi:tripartite-type tricarboxylate transporter receptor subunit TctC
MIRRIVFGAALAVAVAAAAIAQDFPSRPVRMVVPFAAGGATDIVARALGQKLGEAWGQSVVVDNRGGAGGNIGADLVAKAAPDGYTILMTSGSIVTANPHLYKSMPFNPDKDLVAITNVASGPLALVVGPQVAVNSLTELIAYIKANPQKVSMGSAGIGSQTHLIGEQFLYAAGLSATHVPYKGEGPAYTDVISGQVTFMTGNIAPASQFVRGGRLRALAVTTAQRSATLPDTPTMDEAGLKGFDSSGWFGLMAPAGTPQPIIDRIYADTKRIVESDDFRQRLAGLGMVGIANTPAEFAAAIRAESENWDRIIRERNLQVN